MQCDLGKVAVDENLEKVVPSNAVPVGPTPSDATVISLWPPKPKSVIPEAARCWYKSYNHLGWAPAVWLDTEGPFDLQREQARG